MRKESEIFAELRSSGDPETTEALKQEFLSTLNAHSRAIIWNTLHENREDLVNLIAEKTLRNLDRFRGEARFISLWTKRIIQNVLNDALRVTIRSRNEIPVEEIPQEPEDAIHAKLELEEIQGKLDTEERELLILKLEGASYQEIQRSLNLPSEDAARKRWQRLTEKIQEVVA